jgi:hypothetical protein
MMLGAWPYLQNPHEYRQGGTGQRFLLTRGKLWGLRRYWAFTRSATGQLRGIAAALNRATRL